MVARIFICGDYSLVKCQTSGGSVVDAQSHQPIPGAVVARGTNLQESAVTCDAIGGFEIKPIHGWHGAYFIGPISLSLFPGFDIAAPCATVTASAPGYKTHTFPPYGVVPFPTSPTSRVSNADTTAETDRGFISVGELKLERETKNE